MHPRKTTNLRPVLRSHDSTSPISGQYSGHVTSLDQSEVSIYLSSLGEALYLGPAELLPQLPGDDPDLDHVPHLLIAEVGSVGCCRGFGALVTILKMHFSKVEISTIYLMDNFLENSYQASNLDLQCDTFLRF